MDKSLEEYTLTRKATSQEELFKFFDDHKVGTKLRNDETIIEVKATPLRDPSAMGGYAYKLSFVTSSS